MSTSLYSPSWYRVAGLKPRLRTQEEMIRLLSQLHAVDVLQCDVPPDTEEVLKRYEQRRSVKWKQNIRNPLFMRFSVLDPERFLVRFLPFVRPFLRWFGALVWIAGVGAGIFLGGLPLPE